MRSNPVFNLALMTLCLSLSSCTDNEPNVQSSDVAAPSTAEVIPPLEPSALADGPASTRSASWEYVVNNAQRTAEAYAVSRNPNAVFFGPSAEVDFIRQYGGEFEGRYLLNILNRHGSNMSLVVLLPLFDENESSEELDDEGQLWKIVQAKHNGKEF